jgi:pyrrolysine biosynthesis protein PylC
MKLLVVGGKLQGTEAVYLAAKAGYETVLVDRRPAPPASGLADRFVVADITADEALARSLVRACDAVLPACEDEATLAWLAERVPDWGTPLLFDIDAYRVSSSKARSGLLFEKLGVPRPLPWPHCGFPAVVKPDVASGSEGVAVVGDAAGLEEAVGRLRDLGHEAVVEEYVAGPSLSIEVLAWGGEAVALQATGLEFDAGYDCKRVVAPVDEVDGQGRAGIVAAEPAPGGRPAAGWEHAVPAGTLAALDEAAVRLAQGLGLQGIMDVEVMVRGADLRVLEIDARLPSQTPTAVYWSSGANMVELLVAAARDGSAARPGEPPRAGHAPRRACVYQHVEARDGRLQVTGEHVMGVAGPLRLVPGFFGAEEALTDHRPGAAHWSATLIVAGATASDARAAADAVTARIARAEGLRSVPEDEGRRNEEGSSR